MKRTTIRLALPPLAGLILSLGALGQKNWYELHKNLPPALDQYGPLNWVDPDRSEPNNTHYKIFHDRTINADVSYLIYFPPDYEQQTGVRYPVLYYLHGSGGTPRSESDVARLVDKAIRAQRVSPMIVVLVNGLAGDTMYCDTPDGHYPVETVIIKDLIPHVDGAYRTIASREGRAIAGFSMGGFGAAHLGFKYPEIFSVISIEAPTLLGPEVLGNAPVEAWRRLFPTAMGGNMDYFRTNDPFTLAVKNADARPNLHSHRDSSHAGQLEFVAMREAAPGAHGATGPARLLFSAERENTQPRAANGLGRRRGVYLL